VTDKPMAASSDPEVSQDNLEMLRKQDLISRAQELRIKGRSRLNRSGLIRALQEKQK
jgi:hypothetical protein